MKSLLLALLAALLAGIGSREQLLLAAETVRRGHRATPLLAAVAASALTCSLAGLLGSAAAGLAERQRLGLAALGLVLATLALFWRGRKALADPGQLPLPTGLAVAGMLLVLEANGPLPLAVASAAAAGNEWTLAVLGGIVGASVPLILAWALGAEMAAWPMQRLRSYAAALLGFAAALSALAAAGVL